MDGWKDGWIVQMCACAWDEREVGILQRLANKKEKGEGGARRDSFVLFR